MAQVIKKNPLRLGEQLVQSGLKAGAKVQQTTNDAFQVLDQVQGYQSEVADRAAVNAGLTTMRLNRLDQTNLAAQQQFRKQEQEALNVFSQAREKENEIRGLNTFQILGRALTGGELGVSKFAKETRRAAENVQLLRKQESDRRKEFNTKLGTISKRFAIKKSVTDAEQKQLNNLIKMQSMRVDMAAKAQQGINTGLEMVIKSLEVQDTLEEEALSSLDIPSLSTALAIAQAEGVVTLNGLEFGPGKIESLLTSKRQGEVDLQNSLLAQQLNQGKVLDANNTRYIQGRNKSELQQLAANGYRAPTGEVDEDGNPIEIQLSPEEVDKQILALTETTNARVKAMALQPNFPVMARNMSQLVDDANNLALKTGGGHVNRELASVMADIELLQDQFDATVQISAQQAADAGVPASAMPFDEVDIGVGIEKIKEVQQKLEKVKQNAIQTFSTVPEIQQTYAAYLNGTEVQQDQALLQIARLVAVGGVEGLDITDPINAAFASELQKELYVLAKRHEFKGTDVAFTDMNAEQREDLMASVMDALANKGKDGKLLSRPQLAMAVSKAQRQSQVRRIEAYYGRSFATVSPEDRRRIVESGGLPSGLTNFQIQQAFVTAKEMAPQTPGYKEMSGRQKQELDARLTLQALSLIPMAGDKTGRDVFLEQLGTGRSEETLAQMESDQKSGTYVDYMLGQSGIQRSLRQDVYDQNQLFARANAGIDIAKMERMNGLVDDLRDPGSPEYANAVARLAVHQVQGTPKDQEILAGIIRNTPGLNPKLIQQEIKRRIRQEELEEARWEAVNTVIQSSLDGAKEAGKLIVNGQLTVLANLAGVLGPVDVFNPDPDQSAKDERRRLEAGEGR